MEDIKKFRIEIEERLTHDFETRINHLDEDLEKFQINYQNDNNTRNIEKSEMMEIFNDFDEKVKYLDLRTKTSEEIVNKIGQKVDDFIQRAKTTNPRRTSRDFEHHTVDDHTNEKKNTETHRTNLTHESGKAKVQTIDPLSKHWT